MIFYIRYSRWIPKHRHTHSKQHLKLPDFTIKITLKNGTVPFALGFFFLWRKKLKSKRKTQRKNRLTCSMAELLSLCSRNIWVLSRCCISKKEEMWCVLYIGNGPTTKHHTKKRETKTTTHVLEEEQQTQSVCIMYIVFYRTVCPLGRRILGYRRECIYTSAI